MSPPLAGWMSEDGGQLRFGHTQSGPHSQAGPQGQIERIRFFMGDSSLNAVGAFECADAEVRFAFHLFA
jgi:hypothetical protein